MRPEGLQGRLQRRRLRIPSWHLCACSAAQSEATALNVAEMAHFASNVQSCAARIARTHEDTRALLSLKRRLRHGALDCACSHVMLHGSVTDVRDEHVRQALARVHAKLLYERARHDADQELLASEQRQQERWRRRSGFGSSRAKIKKDLVPAALLFPKPPSWADLPCGSFLLLSASLPDYAPGHIHQVPIGSGKPPHFFWEARKKKRPKSVALPKALCSFATGSVGQ